MKTLKLLIKGKVQGVFYRASAKEKADLLAIKGWVKKYRGGRRGNSLPGGAENALREYINWCKQGPARAKVEEVITEETSATAYSDFSIIRGK